MQETRFPVPVLSRTRRDFKQGLPTKAFPHRTYLKGSGASKPAEQSGLLPISATYVHGTEAPPQHTSWLVNTTEEAVGAARPSSPVVFSREGHRVWIPVGILNTTKSVATTYVAFVQVIPCFDKKENSVF